MYTSDEIKVLKEFGNNLRAERKRRNLSQEEFAEEIGLSYGQVIGMIERGEVNTSLLVIVSILKKFNMDFEALFDKSKFDTSKA